MAITIRCRCGQLLGISASHAGKMARCIEPQCRAKFRIPPAAVLARLEGKEISYEQLEAWWQSPGGQQAAGGDTPPAAAPDVPVVQPAVQPVAEPAVQPVAQPVAEPVAQPTPEAARPAATPYAGWGLPEGLFAAGVVLILLALALPWLELKLFGMTVSGVQFRPSGRPIALMCLFVAAGSLIGCGRLARTAWAAAGVLLVIIGGIIANVHISKLCSPIPLAERGAGLYVFLLSAVPLAAGAIIVLVRVRQLPREPRGPLAIGLAAAPAVAMVACLLIGTIVGPPGGMDIDPARLPGIKPRPGGNVPAWKRKQRAQQEYLAKARRDAKARQKKKVDDGRTQLARQYQKLPLAELLPKMDYQGRDRGTVNAAAGDELQRRVGTSRAELVAALKSGKWKYYASTRLAELLIGAPQAGEEEAFRAALSNPKVSWDAAVTVARHLARDRDPKALPALAWRYFETSRHNGSPYNLDRQLAVFRGLLVRYGTAALAPALAECKKRPTGSRNIDSRAQKTFRALVGAMGGPDSSYDKAVPWAQKKMSAPTGGKTVARTVPQPGAGAPFRTLAASGKAPPAAWQTLTSPLPKPNLDKRRAAALAVAKAEGRPGLRKLLALLQPADYKFGQRHRLYAQWAASRAMADVCGVDFGLDHAYWKAWLDAQPPGDKLYVVPRTASDAPAKPAALSEADRQKVLGVVARAKDPKVKSTDFFNRSSSDLRGLDQLAVACMLNDLAAKAGPQRDAALLSAAILACRNTRWPKDKDVLSLYHAGHAMVCGELAAPLLSSWQRSAIVSWYVLLRRSEGRGPVVPGPKDGRRGIRLWDQAARIAELTKRCSLGAYKRGMGIFWRGSRMRESLQKSLSGTIATRFGRTSWRAELIDTPELTRRLLEDTSMETTWAILYALAKGRDGGSAYWIAERLFGKAPLRAEFAMVAKEALCSIHTEPAMWLLLQGGDAISAGRFKNDAAVAGMAEIFKQTKSLKRSVPNSMTLASMLQAMAQSGPSSVPHLMAEIHNRDERVWRAARTALEEHYPQAIIDQLKKEALAGAAKRGLLTNSVGMQFTLIPAGSVAGQRLAGSHVIVTVTIARPFRMGMHEVTQAQYERVMKQNPSAKKGAELPVHSVSWKDATEFCQRLGKLPQEVQARRTYRLPTEKEWVCAAMPGGKDFRSWSRRAVGKKYSYPWMTYEYVGVSAPASVGQKAPNPWGLFDTGGNISEWTSSPWPRDASAYVARGGNFATSSFLVLSFVRTRGAGPSAKIGLRVVCMQAP